MCQETNVGALQDALYIYTDDNYISFASEG